MSESSMFQALYPLAQASPILMLATVEGEKLRVTVTQKETKKGTPLSLSVLASPAELDAELPAAITSACGELATNAPIADQMRAQVEQLKESTAARQKKAVARKKSAPKPAPKKAAPKPAKKAAPAPKPRPKTPTPKARAPQKKPAVTNGNTARHSREACLEDLATLYKKHGAALTRETFLREGATGRSFERHFGGWQKFVASAGFSAAEAASDAPADTTLPLPLDASEPTVANREPPATGTIEASQVMGGPFNEAKVVFDGKGGAEFSAAHPHDESPISFDVRELSSIGDRGLGVITAGTLAPPRPEGWPFQAGSKMRNVVTADGTVIAKEVREVKPGDELHIGRSVYIVQGDTAEEIRVEPRDGTPAARVRNVIDDEGTRVGTWSGESTLIEGCTINVDARFFTVMGFNEKAVFVEPLGPAAGV